MTEKFQAPSVLSRGGDSEPIIHIPEDAKFECHHCGTCCQIFQRIPIEQHRLRHLGTKKRFLETLAELGVDPARVFKEEAGEAVVARKSCGACIFWDAEKLCLIHRIAGEEWKPQVCRDFPYIFRETPDGVYVGLSFACPSVRAKLGQPLAQAKERLAVHALQAARRDSVSGEVRFDERFSVPWEGYVAIERSFRALLQRQDLPLAQRLTACHVLLGLLRIWFQTKYPLSPTLGDVVQVRDQDVLDFLSAVARNNYQEPLRIAARPRGNLVVRRTFFALVLGCAASMWRTGRPVQATWGILRNYLSALVGAGRLELPPLAQKFNFRVLDVNLESLSPASMRLLEDFIDMCLFRKDLAVESGGIRKGLDLLLLQIALAPIYAHALAQITSQAELETISEALGHVEVYFGHHSELFAVIEGFPKLATVLDSFFARKNYPDIILGRVK